MVKNVCVLQFTGGRDSTLTAIKLIEEYKFKELHLLTFQTDLTDEAEAVQKNIRKLRERFSDEAAIHHEYVNTNELLMTLVQDNYLNDIIKFKSFNVSTFCPSCRLSHHANTIIYCLKNNIGNAADGVNKLTGFDLFQQPWAVEHVKKLYEEFGVSYVTPLLYNKVSSEVLLEEYNKEHKLEIPFYESQPKCIGGGQFHNIYLRCYYLPLKGKEKYIEVSKKWIEYKMPYVKEYIHQKSAR